MFFTKLHTEIMHAVKNQNFLCQKSINQPFIMRQAVLFSFYRRKRRSHIKRL